LIRSGVAVGAIALAILVGCSHRTVTTDPLGGYDLEYDVSQPKATQEVGRHIQFTRRPSLSCVPTATCISWSHNGHAVRIQSQLVDFKEYRDAFVSTTDKKGVGWYVLGRPLPVITCELETEDPRVLDAVACLWRQLATCTYYREKVVFDGTYYDIEVGEGRRIRRRLTLLNSQLEPVQGSDLTRILNLLSAYAIEMKVPQETVRCWFDADENFFVQPNEWSNERDVPTPGQLLGQLERATKDAFSHEAAVLTFKPTTQPQPPPTSESAASGEAQPGPDAEGAIRFIPMPAEAETLEAYPPSRKNY